MLSFAGFTPNDYLWVFLPLLGLVGFIILFLKVGEVKDEWTLQQYADNNLFCGVSIAGMTLAVLTLVSTWCINAPRANLQAQLEGQGYSVVAVHYYIGDGTATVNLGGSCPRVADVMYGEGSTIQLFDQNDTRRLHPLLPQHCS